MTISTLELDAEEVAYDRQLRFEDALDSLDVLSSNESPARAIDIVGVLTGIKPGSEIKYDDNALTILEGLDIPYVQFGQDPNMLDRLAISKDPAVANELARIFSYPRDDTRIRRQGELLGYPESSTNYYIKRSRSRGGPDEDALPMIRPKILQGTTRECFINILLSPEHWNEEVEQYVAPLEEATKMLLPMTYEKIEQSVKNKKLSDRALEFTGIKVAYID